MDCAAIIIQAHKQQYGLGIGCHLHLENNRLGFGKIGLGN